MPTIRVVPILLLALSVLTPIRSASAASLFYAFQLFGIPGEGLVVATGVSDQNVVVGWAQTPEFLSHPSGFVRSGDSSTLIDVPGADLLNGTRAYGINNAGSIVGRYTETLGPGSTMSHGFLLENGSLTHFDAPGAQLGTELLDINNSGVIVGHTWLTAGGNLSAFVLDGGNYTFLEFDGVSSISASGINDLGSIVGSMSGPGVSGSPPASDFSAFAIISGVVLPFNISTTYGQISLPSGINNKNQIVGTLAGAVVQKHGFLMDSSGVYQIDIPGANSSGTQVYGINDAGYLVGTVDWPGGNLGFIASPCNEPSSTCIEAPRISDALIDLPEITGTSLLILSLAPILFLRRIS